MLEAGAAFQLQVSSIQWSLTMTPRMLTPRDWSNDYGVPVPGVSAKMNFPVRLELLDRALTLLTPSTT